MRNFLARPSDGGGRGDAPDPALWIEDSHNDSTFNLDAQAVESRMDESCEGKNQSLREKDSIFSPPNADEGGWNIWDLPIQQQPPGIHALLDNLALSRQVLELESDNAELKFKYEKASRVFYEEVSIMREIVKALLRLELPNSAVLLRDSEEQGIPTIFPETTSSPSQHSTHFLHSSSFDSRGSSRQRDSSPEMKRVQQGLDRYELDPSNDKINFDTTRGNGRSTGHNQSKSRHSHPCDPIQFGRLLLNDASSSHWPSRQELQEWCEELQAAATHSQYPAGHRRMYGKPAAVMDQWSSSASSSPVDCGAVESSFRFTESLRSRTRGANSHIAAKHRGPGGESEASMSRSNSTSSVASTATTSPRNSGAVACLPTSDTEESSRRGNASGTSGKSACLKNRRRGRRGGRKHANRRRQNTQQPATSSDYDLSSISLNHLGLSENLSMSVNRSASPSS